MSVDIWDSETKTSCGVTCSWRADYATCWASLKSCWGTEQPMGFGHESSSSSHNAPVAMTQGLSGPFLIGHASTGILWHSAENSNHRRAHDAVSEPSQVAGTTVERSQRWWPFPLHSMNSPIIDRAIFVPRTIIDPERNSLGSGSLLRTPARFASRGLLVNDGMVIRIIAL